MKFQRLKARAFGRLKDWESPYLDQGIILVYGRNESGKSTLFNLITTLFYGWYPASRDENPFVPWGEVGADCEGELLTEQGEAITIARKLRSTPSGMLLQKGNATEVRNRSLPFLEILPREVFREVYAIELSDLHFPRQRAWEAMQQLLLGGQFASFLKPVNQVAAQLEDEANRLWRSDRRGRPRAKEIGDRLSELRTLLQESATREERLRQAQTELTRRQQLLEESIAKKSRLIAYIDRCERIIPAQKRLNRIQQLKAASAYVVNYADLPEDPAGRIKNIDDQLEELKFQKVRLEEKKHQLEGTVQAFTEQHQLLLNRAGEIKVLYKSYDRIRADQDDLKNLEFDLKSKMEQLKQHAAEVLVGGWKPELSKALDAVDTAALRVAIDSFRQAEERHKEQLNRVEALKISAEQRHNTRFVPWLSGMFSLFGFVGFMLLNALPIKFLSALIMVSGITLLVIWWLFGRRSGQHIGLELEEKRLEQLNRKVEEAHSQVNMLLKDVPIVPQRLELPDSSLLLDINKLKELVRYIQQGIDKKDAILKGIEQIRRRALQLLEECALNNISSEKQMDVLEAIDLLHIVLQESEKRYQDAQNAKWQLEDLKIELSRVNEVIKQLEEEKSHLLSRLSELPGESVQDKIKKLVEDRALARQADSMLEELTREYPDLKDIERQIDELTKKNQEWALDDEMLARAKAERDQIEHEINALNNEIGTLKKEIEMGAEQGNMDQLEGEVVLLEAELKQVARQRDRLMLMRNVILEAEKRFREEHQPDVLRKAGKYLSAITDGRYTRLFMMEGMQDTLLVKCGTGDEVIEVKEGTLSRGTLEQVYLSLRLAFMDHLDPGGNPLPAFLDEVFVNWDGFRLDNGFGLLKELAKQRQVFIFTCHDWLVERLSAKLNVQVVELRM